MKTTLEQLQWQEDELVRKIKQVEDELESEGADEIPDRERICLERMANRMYYDLDVLTNQIEKGKTNK